MPQAFLHRFIQNAAVPYPRQLQPVGNVLINSHREGIGLLENHPHLPAQMDGVQGRGSHVHPVNADGAARDAGLRNAVIHPVDAAQQRGLSTSGRADERRHPVSGNLHGDMEQGLLAPITKIQGIHLYGGLIGGGWMRSHVRSNGASCAVDRMVSQKRSSRSTTGL